VTLRVEAADAFRGPVGSRFARGGATRNPQVVPDRELGVDVHLRNALVPP